MEAVFFYALAMIALVSAGLLVFFFRNPVYSALALIVTLLANAGLFALLDGHFIAAVQIMIYAGAIMVLFLFVTMLLNLQEEELGAARLGPAKAAAVLAVGFVTWQVSTSLLGVETRIASAAAKGVPQATLDQVGTVETVGRTIFSSFLVPFEVTSVLILAAIVASVVVAKKRV